VKSHTVDYLVPAFEGDRLLAATWVASMETSSSWRRYAFLRESDRRPVALARTLWIHVDRARGRPKAIPGVLRDAFPIVADDDPGLAALGIGPGAPS
jgi:acyl-CoA thioester hydrolase